MILSAFQSEWIKMRRRRLWFGSYGAITGVVLLTTIVTIAGALHHPDSANDLTLAQLAHASGLSQGIAQSGVLLGAVSFSIAAAQFGGEFAHGTLRNLLVRQPWRTVLMTGKLLAVLTFLIGAVVVATIIGICAAFAMAHARGVPTDAWTSGVGMGDLGIALGDLAISTCGFAIVGMLLGVLLRSSVIGSRPVSRSCSPSRRSSPTPCREPHAGCPVNCSRRSPKAAPQSRRSGRRSSPWRRTWLEASRSQCSYSGGGT